MLFFRLLIIHEKNMEQVTLSYIDMVKAKVL